MKEAQKDKERSREVLNWSRANRNYWRIICTPNDEQMTPDMIKKIIINLQENSLYELIFVMLTVHRKTAFVNDILSDITNYMMYRRWNKENDGIINRITKFLE